MIKILLVDDHGIVRDGIKSTLTSEKNFKIIGEASNGQEAIEKVKKLSPDVVIMDISMPGMNGIEATTAISKRFPGTRTLMLSMHDNEDYVLKSLESGAAGYILKDTGKEEFVKAINIVANGEKYFSIAVSNILATGYLHRVKNNAIPSEGENDDPHGLSKRERKILKMIVQGNNNKDIADELSLSVRTIETHRFNIMKKMKVKNALEMVKMAMEKKMV